MPPWRSTTRPRWWRRPPLSRARSTSAPRCSTWWPTSSGSDSPTRPSPPVRRWTSSPPGPATARWPPPSTVGPSDSTAVSDVLAAINQDPDTRAFFADIDDAIAEIGTPAAARDPEAELMLQATTFANSLTVLDRFGRRRRRHQRRPRRDRRAADPSAPRTPASRWSWPWPASARDHRHRRRHRPLDGQLARRDLGQRHRHERRRPRPTGPGPWTGRGEGRRGGAQRRVGQHPLGRAPGAGHGERRPRRRARGRRPAGPSRLLAQRARSIVSPSR